MERFDMSVLENAIQVSEFTKHQPYDEVICAFLKELKQYRDAEEQGLLTKVVHGEWVDTQPNYNNGYHKNAHKCSNCGDYYTTEYEDLYYCPRCGAKMDLKQILKEGAE